MEGQEKPKKGSKEKRSTKKAKAVILPAKDVPATPLTQPIATAAPAPATVSAPAEPVAKAKRTKKEAPVKKELAPAVKKVVAPLVKKEVTPPRAPKPTFEEIQLQAYFVGERRKKYGIPGDETSDWIEAELTLKAQYGSKLRSS